MNYLAHIFLSGNDRQLQIGNFIGDFVKGKDYNYYPEKIRKGIILHRKIDHFADNHALYKESIDILKPDFGRYSGIITDMYSDFFLATEFQNYNQNIALKRFARNFYFSAFIYYRYLPQRVKNFIFHFIVTNRLLLYSEYDGLKDSLQIMSEYKTRAINPERTIDFLKSRETDLRSNFKLFMPEIIRYVNSEIFN